MPLVKQLSLFGVEAAPPSPADLAGLLAGPGQIVRMGGTARVSVVVTDRWRALALITEMRMRGLAATAVSTVEENFGVRTPYSTALAPLAAAWLHGAVTRPPAGFALDGRRVRLWLIAAGHREASDVTLRLGRVEEQVPRIMQRALASLGLPSDMVGSVARASGAGLRISGRRRLNRLAEVVGDAPVHAPEGEWP
jgi:hypothetical protein